MSTNNSGKLLKPMRVSGLSVCGFSLLVALALPAQANPAFTEWSTPLSTVGGGCPIESRNGNELFTASRSAGTLDIWVYRRSGRNDEFGDRTIIGPPVSLGDADDFCPTPLPGNWLLFVSTRIEVGACGGADMYIARTNPAKGPGSAENLGCGPDGPNTAGREMSPSLVTTADGIYLYFSSNVGGDHDIYRSEMAPNGSFGPGSPVASLNTGSNDQQPNVSRDGLTIVFASNRDGGPFDIYMSTRDSLDADWSTPRNLSDELLFPTASLSETRPSLSWDLKRLYYGSAGIIYRSTRQPAPRSD
jgi:hypothetical protein